MVVSGPYSTAPFCRSLGLLSNFRLHKLLQSGIPKCLRLILLHKAVGEPVGVPPRKPKCARLTLFPSADTINLHRRSAFFPGSRRRFHRAAAGHHGGESYETRVF